MINEEAPTNVIRKEIQEITALIESLDNRTERLYNTFIDVLYICPKPENNTKEVDGGGSVLANDLRSLRKRLQAIDYKLGDLNGSCQL